MKGSERSEIIFRKEPPLIICRSFAFCCDEDGPGFPHGVVGLTWVWHCWDTQMDFRFPAAHVMAVTLEGEGFVLDLRTEPWRPGTYAGLEVLASILSCEQILKVWHGVDGRML